MDLVDGGVEDSDRDGTVIVGSTMWLAITVNFRILLPIAPQIDITGIDQCLLNYPLFQELMAEGLAIQNRSSAEPVYVRTGKGF